MNYMNNDALVSTQWLEQHMNSSNLKIIDATYFLPNDNRNSIDSYSQCHIPGAVFFNIDKICDTATQLPHMLPSQEVFSSLVGKLGISNNNLIIVYDRSGGYMAACRVWWMFKIFGSKNVAVLNGGLPKWIDEKRSTTNFKTEPEEQIFYSNFNHNLVKNLSQVYENIDKDEFQVIDARSEGRFCGFDTEPRPTKKVGHIPGSFNLPFINLLKPEEHFTFKSASEIQATFEQIGVNFNKPITTTCGSGVTAAVLTFALYLIGYRETAIYDGSWAEWGDHQATKVES